MGLNNESGYQRAQYFDDGADNQVIANIVAPDASNNWIMDSHQQFDEEEEQPSFVDQRNIDLEIVQEQNYQYLQ